MFAIAYQLLIHLRCDGAASRSSCFQAIRTLHAPVVFPRSPLFFLISLPATFTGTLAIELPAVSDMVAMLVLPASPYCGPFLVSYGFTLFCSRQYPPPIDEQPHPALGDSLIPDAYMLTCEFHAACTSFPFLPPCQVGQNKGVWSDCSRMFWSGRHQGPDQDNCLFGSE